MKTNTMNRKRNAVATLLAIALLASLPCMRLVLAADAPQFSGANGEHHQAIKVGSYKGTLNGDTGVTLLVEALDGRNESYLGVVIQGHDDSSRVALYLLDPLSDSQYTLTPILVTEDGEIGFENADPSLIMNLGQPDADGERDLVLTNANSSNREGFQGSMVFTRGEHAKMEWLDYQAGTYSSNGNDKAALLSPMTRDRQTTALFTAKSISGNFQIREKLAGIFALKAVSYTSAGARVENSPKRVGIFVKERGLFTSSVHFLLLNPSNDQDVLNFKLN